MIEKIKIGIDWGTDKCILSYIKDNKINIINDNNNYSISTVIGISDNNLILIGNEINKNINYDIKIIKNLKRLVGIDIYNNKYNTIIKYFNNLKININYDDNNNDIILNFNNNKYYLSELIINIMKYLYELIINNNINDFETVITVPAYFNEYQRRYILNCANKANLNCLKLINEPVSACLSYLTINTNSLNYDDINIIIFDFGAGTLDLAIISASYDDNWLCEVESSIGDNELGGIDIDDVLIDWIKNDNIDLYNLIIERNENINKLIYDIKLKLSNEDDDSSIIYNICGYNMIFNVQKYYELLENRFSKRIYNLMDKLIEQKYGNCDINNIKNYSGILLIGGSSKNKWINKLLDKYKLKILNQQIKVLIDNEIKYVDIKDTGVSIGATDLSKYNNRELILIDTVPLSIGIEEINGFVSKIIPKNTIIPCSITKDYTLINDDNDNTLIIKIYQGERELAKDNFYIGEFILKDIKYNKNVNTRIQITINIDINNIITVTANEWRSDNKSIFTIETDKIKLPQNNIDNNINNYHYIDKQNKLLFNSYYDFITNIDRIYYNLFITQIKNITNDQMIIHLTNLFNSIKNILLYLNNIDHININKLFNIINKIYNDYNDIYNNDLINDIYIDYKNINYENIDINLLIKKIEESKDILNDKLKIFMIYYEELNNYNDEKNITNIIDEDLKINNIDTIELDNLIDILIDSIDDIDIDNNKKLELLLYLKNEKECLDMMKISNNILTEDYIKNKIEEINEFCEKLNN